MLEIKYDVYIGMAKPNKNINCQKLPLKNYKITWYFSKKFISLSDYTQKLFIIG